MKREIYRYLGLFVLSVALAFWAARPSKDKDPDRKSVFSIASAQVTGFDFSSPEGQVKARIESGKWWIETTKASVTERFLASAKMQDFLAQWNPLEAVRVVGVIKDDQLADYGLKDANKFLTVLDAKGQEAFKLTIGKPAYGSRNVFARESRENRVILISGDLVSDIERPDLKLYERTITNVVFEELQKAEIFHSSKSRRLSHTKRDDKGILMWTDDVKEGAAVASAKGWFERLDRVRIVSFATAAEVSTLDQGEPLFKVEFEGAGNSADQLVFVKRPGSPGPQGQPAADEYFVKSKFLGTWAKVASTRLEPIEKDLPSLLGP